jgi:hypothetical protein
MELERVDLSLTDSPEMLLIECGIKNYGGSVAFIVGSLYECWIGDGETHEGLPMTLPEVIAPSDSPHDPAMFLPDKDEVVGWSLWGKDDPRIQAVRMGQQSIYLRGFILYDNIFDETWILSFRREFSVSQYGDGFGLGQWSRDGDAENYERLELPKNSAKPN